MPLPAPISPPAEASTRPAGPIMARCVKITPESHDVRTFTFVAEPPFQFSYKPGQFITLELPMDGHVLRRSYTISSSPTRPHSFAITVKRVPKGWVSNWLHEEMKVGAEYRVSGPYGDFSCENHPADQLLMISAGSGVTPMMSMLRFLADMSAPTSIVFINNVRTPADIIFEKELMDLSARFGEALKLGFPDQFAARTIMAKPGRPLERSRLARAGAGFHGAGDVCLRAARLCGDGAGDLGGVGLSHASLPSGAVRAGPGTFRPGAAYGLSTSRTGRVLRRATQAAGTAPAPMVAPPPAAPPASAQTEIVFQQSGVTVSCADGDVILDVAEQHGLALASSCRSGVCGACKIQKTEGMVEMGEQTVLNEWDIADGYVLACLGTVHGRVVIDA